MPSSARTILSALTAMLRLSGASPSPAACCSLLLGRCAVRQDRHVLAIVAAVRAHHVRALQLATVLALDVGHRRQGVMGPAHVAARLRNLLLWNSHDDLHDGAADWPGPKKVAAALYRRGRRLSLAKTSHHRNNLAATARLVSEGRQPGKRMPALLGLAFSPAV